jgi:uncharacterized protein (TIGR02266 family)
MAAKRKQKDQKKRKSQRGPRTAKARPPTAEEVIGAVVESLVAPLLEEPREEPAPDERPSSTSEAHAIPPRGEEHRAFPRVAVAVAIGLETESHFFSGLSGDVSEGGVFVQTYRELPVGRGVEVHFELPEGELTAHGQVRWHRTSSDSSPPGLGIAFEGLDDEQREIIQRFCERRAPLYYEVEHG